MDGVAIITKKCRHCVHRLQKHKLCYKCNNCMQHVYVHSPKVNAPKTRAARAVCEEMCSFIATMLKYTALRFCQKKVTTLWAKDQHTISKINTTVYIALLHRHNDR